LGELTNDRSKNYLNIIFEIFEVKGDKANTRFKKFFIPQVSKKQGQEEDEKID